MTKPLDTQFAKVVALMRSTVHAGEKANAMASAEVIARRCGMTLDQALRIHDSPPAPQSTVRNIFDDFDDWMEEREPGHKAKCAAAKSEKESQRLGRVAEIIARYGGRDAALGPCWREQAVHAALRSLRHVCEPPFERWTRRVDGYDPHDFKAVMPENIRHAIGTAYPLPATFRAAKAEHEYWVARRREIEDVLGPQNYGDDGLDLVARLRADMVRDLAEKDLPVTTLVDLHARFAMYQDHDTDSVEIENALFRDLTALVETEQQSGRADVDKPADRDLNDLDQHVAAGGALPITDIPRDRVVASPPIPTHSAAQPEPEAKPRLTPKPKAGPSPWPTFATLRHFGRCELLDRIARSVLPGMMKPADRADFEALRKKIVQRPQEIVTRKEANLFNRLSASFWAMSQNKMEAA